MATRDTFLNVGSHSPQISMTYLALFSRNYLHASTFGTSTVLKQRYESSSLVMANVNTVIN